MVESCLDFNMVYTRIQLVGNVNLSVFNVIYSLPLTDKYETENQKSDTKRRAVLDGAGTFLGQVHPPLQNIPKVMYNVWPGQCRCRSDRCAIQHFFCEI